MAISEWIAGGSLALAIVLAIGEGRRRARERRLKLSVNHHFTSDEPVENKVIIENVSSGPVLISSWELFWVRRRWWGRKITKRVAPDEPTDHFTIAPHSTHDLIFSGSDYFGWGADTAEHGRLWIELSVVGQRQPVRLLVYKFQSPSRRLFQWSAAQNDEVDLESLSA